MLSTIDNVTVSSVNETNATFLNNTTTGGHRALYNTPVLAIVLLMIAILLVGVIGNSIVVLIVVKKKRMQTVTNWLILNLAVADLSSTLICIPLEIPMELKHGSWLYGEHFCTVFYPIQTITIYGSVFTLVALSLTRYWAIIHPFRSQPTLKMAKILIGVIWVCSGLVVLPYFLVLKYNNDTGSCEEVWTFNQRRTYTIAIFVFQYVLPLSVISLAYIYIVYDLCYPKNNTALPKDASKENDTKKVVKLLLIITVTFAVCILPYHLVALFSEFGDAQNFVYYEDVSISSYMLLYLNSAMNPIMYNVFNAKFRESYFDLYKTIIAYICNKGEDLHGQGFFSSRRPSVLDNVRKWSKGSNGRSFMSGSTCSSSTVVCSPNHSINLGKRAPQYLTTDYSSNLRSMTFRNENNNRVNGNNGVHLFPPLLENTGNDV